MSQESNQNTNSGPSTSTKTQDNNAELYDKAKLTEIAKQVKTYWIKYLDILSSNKSKDQMVAELKNLEASADLWNLSVKLEGNVTISPQNKELYNWLVQFTDAVGTAIDFQIVDFTTDVKDPTNNLAYNKHHEAEAKAVDLIMYYRNYFGNDF